MILGQTIQMDLQCKCGCLLKTDVERDLVSDQDPHRRVVVATVHPCDRCAATTSPLRLHLDATRTNLELALQAGRASAHREVALERIESCIAYLDAALAASAAKGSLT